MRWAGILAALAIVLGMGCVTVQAEEPPRLEMVRKETLDSTTVEIQLEAIGIQKAAMMQFAVQYDESSLECVSAVQGDMFQNNLAPTINTRIPGHVYFAWDSLNEVEKDGTVMTLRFHRIKQDETAVTFDFREEFLVADGAFQQIDVTAEGVTIPQAAEQNTETASEAPAQTEERTGSNQGLTMNANRLDLTIGQSEMLSVLEKTETLYWESSNEAVASVENGKVTALAPGEAVITAMTEDGMQYASCVVTSKNVEETKRLLMISTTVIVAILLVLFCYKQTVGKRENNGAH